MVTDNLSGCICELQIGTWLAWLLAKKQPDKGRPPLASYAVDAPDTTGVCPPELSLEPSSNR